MLQSHTTTVAGRLREARALAGHSVRSIAPLVGVTRTTVSNWENGLSEPSISQFALWAAATKQPLDRMIEGLEWCTPRDLNPEPTDSAFWAIVDRLELELDEVER